MIKSIQNNIYFLKNIVCYSKAYVIGEAFVAVIEGLIPLLDIVIPKMIIDDLIAGNSFSNIIFLVIIYSVLYFLGSFFSTFITEKYIHLNEHLYAMHFLLMINRKKIDLDLASLDDPKVHQQIALAEDLIYKGIGIDIIDSFFTAITSIVNLCALTMILMTANPYLLLLILLFACIFTIFHLKEEQREFIQRDETMYLTRILNYYIKIMGEKSCAKEMRIYGFAEWLMEKYYKTLKILKGRLKKLYYKNLQIRTIGIFLETIKNNGIYLYLAWLALKRKITIGEFSQYFNAASQFSESILELVSFFITITINGNYIASFRSFMEMQPIISRDKNCYINTNIKKELWELSLSHVTFSYRGMVEPVLKDIDYTFEQGKIYLLVGENGAGKTTLLQLLLHLYQPCKGEIKLNQIPIDEFNDKEYKNLFGVVFQDFQYFSFTIGENIALSSYKKGDPFIEKRIENAVKKAGLKKKIDSFKNGINTNLDKIFYEDGVILSGGESQKLAFARALFREAKILILDEPSSALDPIAENELFQIFQEIAGDKIVIYISHRLSCAAFADEILLLKDGRICESGTHKELLQKQGDYANYYHLQAQYYAKDYING